MKRDDPLHPKLLPFLIEVHTQIAMNFAAQRQFEAQCLEYASIPKDWIEFVLSDIGYEILCEECYADKLEDEARAAKSKNITYQLFAQDLQQHINVHFMLSMFLSELFTMFGKHGTPSIRVLPKLHLFIA